MPPTSRRDYTFRDAASANLTAALSRSASLTIAYRRYTFSVLWPSALAGFFRRARRRTASTPGGNQGCLRPTFLSKDRKRESERRGSRRGSTPRTTKAQSCSL
jgi:hypothetical protein